MRLFVAIDLPDELKRFLTELNSAFSNFKGLKTVNSENLHLTLLFLGDKEDPKKIIGLLRSISFKKFDLIVNDFGFFPNEQRINVVWAKTSFPDEFKNLQNKLAVIFKDKNEFIPHITFLRVKYFKDLEKDAFKEILSNYAHKTFKFSVNKFKLYNSELTSMGPIHGVVDSFSAENI